MTNRDYVAIAFFSALLIACGFLPPVMLPYLPVPITAQTLAVMLSGALLGSKRGFYAIALVWILAAFGFPVLAGGKGGISSFFAPSTGYLLGFGAAAYCIGKLFELFQPRNIFIEFVIIFFGGLVLIHFLGVIWLSYYLKIPILKALLSDLIFVPGDFIKIIISLFVLGFIRKNFPTAFSS